MQMIHAFSIPHSVVIMHLRFASMFRIEMHRCNSALSDKRIYFHGKYRSNLFLGNSKCTSNNRRWRCELMIFKDQLLGGSHRIEKNKAEYKFTPIIKFLLSLRPLFVFCSHKSSLTVFVDMQMVAGYRCKKINSGKQTDN